MCARKVALRLKSRGILHMRTKTKKRVSSVLRRNAGKLKKDDKRPENSPKGINRDQGTPTNNTISFLESQRAHKILLAFCVQPAAVREGCRSVVVCPPHYRRLLSYVPLQREADITYPPLVKNIFVSSEYKQHLSYTTARHFLPLTPGS